MDAVHDRGACVLVTERHDLAIQIGLHLGVAKYGNIRQLAGSNKSCRKVVTVSVEVGPWAQFYEKY